MSGHNPGAQLGVDKVLTVVDAVSYNVLGHLATPRLIQQTSDGTPALAWEYEGVWRVEDAAFDDRYMRPEHGPYRRVLAGWMPRRTRAEMPGNPERRHE